MKLAGEALDALRKDLRRHGAEMPGGPWAVRGNGWTRSTEQQRLREQLCGSSPKLAMALRATLQGCSGWPGRWRAPMVAAVGGAFPSRSVSQTGTHRQEPLGRHPEPSWKLA